MSSIQVGLVRRFGKLWRTSRSDKRSDIPVPGDTRGVQFYRHERGDHRGRWLSEILTWNHRQLAESHDYIQWLFPLAEPSEFNPHAPLLGPEEIAAFSSDSALRDALLEAFVMMLGFYGLRIEGVADEVRIVPAHDFASRAPDWLTRRTHEARRITRILRSTYVLGLMTHARALFACLQALASSHPGRVSEEALAHWAKAVDLENSCRTT